MLVVISLLNLPKWETLVSGNNNNNNFIRNKAKELE